MNYNTGSNRWYNRYVKVLVCLEDHLGGILTNSLRSTTA